MLKIIPLDASEEPYRAPDLIWGGEAADLMINALIHPLAPGDIRAEQGLATQVLIYLMTDARVEPSELPEGVENRGWFGDSFDLAEGETALGSKLWLLRRRAIFDGIEIEVEDYVRSALQTLLDQGAVASIDIAVNSDRARNRVDFEVSLYGRSGNLAFAQKYQLLWDQIDGVANPLRS
jgi:phage gp46-like protein